MHLFLEFWQKSRVGLTLATFNHKLDKQAATNQRISLDILLKTIIAQKKSAASSLFKKSYPSS